MKIFALFPLFVSLAQAAPAKKAAPLSPEEALCKRASNGTIAQVNAALKNVTKFDHVCDGWGDTALEIAVLNGRSKVVAALLKAGATPKSVAPDASPVLFKAHDADSVKLLLAAGAGVDERDKNGSTPLCSQASTTMILTDKDGPARVSAIVEALIAAKADVDATCEDGATPLILAAHGGNSVALKVLLAHGADFTRSDRDNRTALWYANFYATGAGASMGDAWEDDGEPARCQEIVEALRAKGATR